mmetsp:Transcript_16611/g.38986  ORF Transcript_16611/g.38986 Transcript_16611/m.38986 type:complete len:220 (-) Transcript_16611:2-661(-)
MKALDRPQKLAEDLLHVWLGICRERLLPLGRPVTPVPRPAIASSVPGRGCAPLLESSLAPAACVRRKGISHRRHPNKLLHCAEGRAVGTHVESLRFHVFAEQHCEIHLSARPENANLASVDIHIVAEHSFQLGARYEAKPLLTEGFNHASRTPPFECIDRCVGEVRDSAAHHPRCKLRPLAKRLRNDVGSTLVIQTRERIVERLSRLHGPAPRACLSHP